MKILEVIEGLGPGGAQRFVVDLSNELSRNNKVGILTLISRGDCSFYEREINKRVYRIKYNGGYGLLNKVCQIIVSLILIINYKPDIIHLHDRAFIYGILPSLFLRNTKIFYTVHNLANKDAGNGFGAWLRKNFLKKLIKPITISNVCSQSFFDYYRYPSYATIYNGCRDITTTTLLSSTTNEINKYRYSPQTKIFLNIARLMKQKNHELLISSFNSLISSGEDVVLIIMGDFQASNRRVELYNLVQNKDRIIFIGNKENVADYLSATDYFCLSSSWEGLPITLLEAGLMGKYSISTPVGGVPEVLNSKKIGVVSDDLSIESYVNTILSLKGIEIDNDYIKLYFKNKFSMEICATNYLKIFNR